MKGTMKTIAIIPARGGSKGIPDKNIRPLSGKPLIAHIIRSSLASNLINRTIVSTDDSRISNIAENHGAETITRPVEMSRDDSPSELALLHVLDHLKETENYLPDLLVFLQCTSPFTLPEDIDGTIQALLDNNADTALSVIPFHYFLWKKTHDGNSIGVNHDKKIRQMRQDREAQYLESGSVYVMRVDGFKKNKHRFFGKTVMHEIPSERCFEIDEPVDFRIAEILMNENKVIQSLITLPKEIDAIIFDFDGVFTDNRVFVNQEGLESVACDRGDGMGISHLRNLGISILVLSTEKNQVVRARCDKLKIECLHGVPDKISALTNWANQKRIDFQKVVYVGNDINDLECLEAVGCSVVVNDAHQAVKQVADLILTKPGGRGAIRELCDLIEKKREVG
jgi:N-acylneuraminate cytidylyltransferase